MVALRSTTCCVVLVVLALLTLCTADTPPDDFEGDVIKGLFPPDVPRTAACPDDWQQVMLHDFSGHQEDFVYTAEELDKDFGSVSYGIGTEPDEFSIFPTVEVVESEADPTNKALAQHFPKGCSDAGSCAYQFRINLPAVDEAWLAYSLLFEKDFEFELAGMLPGLCGGTCPLFSQHSNDTSGFSSVAIWSETEGFIKERLTCANTTEKPFEVDYATRRGSQMRLKPGYWHSLRVRVKLNDPGEANGELEAWLDGALAHNSSDMVWRNHANIHIDYLAMISLFGKPGVTVMSPKDQSLYIDNLLVCSPQNTTVFSPAAISTRTQVVRCQVGMRLVSGVCVDVDECQNDGERCAHICLNNEGSFTCACNSGYALYSDQRSCERMSPEQKISSSEETSVDSGAAFGASPLPITHYAGLLLLLVQAAVLA